MGILPTALSRDYASKRNEVVKMSVKKNRIPVSPLLLWSIVGIIYLLAFMYASDIELFKPIIDDRTLLVLAVIWTVWMFWSLIANRQKFKEAGNITKIAKHGPYAIVRHPIYLADLIAILIVIAAYPRLWIMVGSFLAVPIIIYWAKKEEDVLLQAFGKEYEYYAVTKGGFNPLTFLSKKIFKMDKRRVRR